MKRMAAEFMQYRWWVGAGPSSKTCPKCESAWRERTSTRSMPSESSVLLTAFPGSSGRVKLGQPVPESYLSRDEKSGSPETMST